MNAFQCEKQGANTYTMYEISKEEEVDSLSLGMLLNNKIRGLAPVIYGQMDEVQCLRYNISSKTSLSQYLTGILSRERILKIFRSVTETILEAEEYMIEPSSILLDPEHVFVDSQTGETAVICLPLMDMEGTDVSTFFKNIMFSSNAIFDSKENCDYVARIINHLNRAETFSLVNFRDLLMELERETQGMQGVAGENLVPETGVVSGVVGSNAVPGVMGTQGAVGRNGTPGTAGMQGTVGRNGMPGTAGMQGATGKNGTPGMAGMQGTGGRNGMPGTVGAPGTSGVGNVSGTQNGPVAWGASMGGAQGIPESNGASGANGVSGVRNANGLSGTNGMQGANIRPQTQGANGMSGINGASGARGVGGMSGRNGTAGAQGISPVRGISPVQPMSGAKGSLGMRGTSGMLGAGVQGNQPQSVGFEIPGAVSAAELVMEKEKKKWSLFGSKSDKKEKNRKTDDKKKSSKKEQGGKKSGGIFGNVFGGKKPSMEGMGNAGSGYPYGGNVPYDPDETSIAMEGDEVTTLLDNEPRLVRERNQEIIFLQKDVFRIGRKREVVDYCIEGNPTIGRCHAVIVKKGDMFYIVDAGSKNHTYVNGMMIESNVEVPLENQAVIKLSDEGFVFEMG